MTTSPLPRMADSGLVDPMSELGTCTIQKLDFLQKLFFLLRIHNLKCMRRIQIDFLNSSLLGTFLGICESKDLIRVAVVNTAEFLTGTDWPVNRAGCDSKLFFDLVKKIKGIVGITVLLIL